MPRFVRAGPGEFTCPYICHVPNCITRYVGSLYKMALRSHRLGCHRSICRIACAPRSLVSSLIFLPLTFSPFLHLFLSSVLFLFVPLSFSSLTHTQEYSALHSRHMVRGPTAFIHNTHGSKSLAPRRNRSDSPPQNDAARTAPFVFTVEGIFKNKLPSGKTHFAGSCRWVLRSTF